MVLSRVWGGIGFVSDAFHGFGSAAPHLSMNKYHVVRSGVSLALLASRYTPAPEPPIPLMLQIALMEREILAASSTPDHDRAPKFSFTLFMLLSQPFARSFIPNRSQ